MDRRLTPANGRVAASHLKGDVAAEAFVDPAPAAIAADIVDLCDSPNGRRDRQLLLGAPVGVFERRDGWAFIQAEDGYVGYVDEAALCPHQTPTHFVGTQATHAYAQEDFKSDAVMALAFGARVTVLDERRRFFETNAGFVPKSHLRRLEQKFADPATIAQLHFGVPYLWGGNSTRGIDCSGLVSAATWACGIPCPGDSDLQLDQVGTPVTQPNRRADLVFWKGHVGMMVDETTLIHANAHHMAVQYEKLESAILRIKAQGGGLPLAYKRL